MAQYLVYVWPALALVLLGWFFVDWWRDTAVLRPEAPHYTGQPLTLPVRRGRMTRRDAALLAGLCAVYGAVAFLGLGDTKAPQSAWQAAQGETHTTLTFSQPIDADCILYYPLLNTGSYTVEVSTDGKTFQPLSEAMDQTYVDLFKWRELSLDGIRQIRSLRITADATGLELGEIALCNTDGDGNFFPVSVPLSAATGSGGALLDEQDTVPTRFSYLNSSYFDEIYHPRTAYEHVRGVYPYEITHPPLGKLILSLGIRMFGMTPFGWRFMGTLFGVLMLPLLYLLIKSMFGKTCVAFCGTALFAFDFMHYVQTRLATIDTYGVFFTLLMYLFFWYWLSCGEQAPFRKTAPWLFAAGISFGLGVCCKWTCIYAGGGLFVLYCVALFLRGRGSLRAGQGRAFGGFLIKTLALSAAAFLILPAVIYTLCYIPYASASSTGLSLSSLLDEMLRNQTYMFSYHSGVTDPHPYSSAFYLWILDLRPILYYRDYWGDLKSAFSAFGNPVIWVGGLIALFCCVSRYLRQKVPAALFLIIGYLAQFVPWMLVSRPTFAYHYFPSTVFLVLALCLVFSDWIDCAGKKGRRRTALFTGVCLGLFLLFYPSLSGIYMPGWYFDIFLRWLPSWPL